jgi:diaminopimelate epimerase
MIGSLMNTIPFLKMHGTGNDFVLLDARARPVTVDRAMAKRLSDRHFGIGCDQLLVLRQSKVADAFMQIFNADGSEISTCGNATRCVSDFLMREHGRPQAQVETAAGIRHGTRVGEGDVEVNMGVPRLQWQEIPLAESRNTLHLGLELGLLVDPVAVNMGNPHAVFFVRDLAHIKLAEWGEKLEHHPLFPERANISAVQVLAENHLRMQVWERGTGLTLACGSAACAAVVAGVLRGYSVPQCRVDLPGGTLEIAWQRGEGNTGDVRMRGAVAYVFKGEIES